MKKKVFISVDCGFDKFKVAINEYFLLSFSSKMVDATDIVSGTNAGIGPNNTYIEKNGRIYEFGDSIDYALSLKSNLNKYKEYLETFRNIGRFHTEAFNISLLAAIGYSIYSHDLTVEPEKHILPNLADMDLYIGIALPHESLNEWDGIKAFLNDKHSFKLLIGSSLEPFKLDLNLTDAKFLCNSQVIASFLYQATDDDGNMNLDDNNLLPCAVIDAGYKTLGCFEIAENLSINSAESNMDFAMLNIDNLVAEQVRSQGKSEFHYLQVQHHARGKGKDTIRSGNEEIDVKTIYENVLKSQATKFLSYSERIFSLDDLSSLLVTGGTGIAYFPTIKAYMDQHHKGLQTILTDKPYKSEEKINPMYAIVLGLHKQLQARYK